MVSTQFKDNLDLFKCPICSSGMELDGSSLICGGRHCFDIARNGYVNFLLRPVKSDYDKSMLSSRNIILKSGFFDPLAEQISKFIEGHFNFKYMNKPESDLMSAGRPRRFSLLDVGCGEGTLLDRVVFKLTNKLNDAGFDEIVGVGIDISKEGIQIASKQYRNNIWCVGDLANSPFQNKKINVILNILSPSNYSEFDRLLADDGLLIKAVPGSSYLKELRELFYDNTDKKTYSNEKVLAHFKENFELIETTQVNYTFGLDKENLEHLIKMTPLSWNADADKRQKALNSGINQVTVDLTVMCGRKE